MASAGDRWTQKPQYRVGLLVLERKRDGFDVAWGKKTRGKCWEALVTICGNNGYALKPLNGDHERVALVEHAIGKPQRREAGAAFRRLVGRRLGL